MNKKLLISLSLLLGLFLASCSSPLANSDYTGDWYEKEHPANKVFTINKDGTIVYTSGGENITSEKDSVKELAKNKFEAKFTVYNEISTFIFEFSSKTEGKVTIKNSQGQEVVRNWEIMKK